MYWVVAVTAAVLAVPLIASVPFQPPEAVQEVAFVADQVSVDVLPLATLLGVAVKLTTGAVAVTETVWDCEALPPVPVHVIP